MSEATRRLVLAVGETQGTDAAAAPARGATCWAAGRVTSPSTTPGSSDRRALAAVWGCWLVAFVSALVVVLISARDLPEQEDWNLVPALTGHQAHFLNWLWSQNNEHRLPLPKLVYLGLLKLWPDFRVGMVFNIVLLAAIAAGLMIFVRRLRGRTQWTDAFFPIAFLNLGNWENMGWGWQMQFVIATALACGLLVGIWANRELTSRGALGVGGCLVGIPLTGATALPFAPLVSIALLPRLRSERRSVRAILVLSIVVSLGICAVYFVGLTSPSINPSSPNQGATLETGSKFLALSVGPAAGAWWFGGAMFVIALLVGSGVMLIRANGVSKWAQLAFLTGGAALALELGVSRTGLLPYYGLPDRYALTAVPILCCAYLAYLRYGKGTWRHLGPALICAGLIAALPMNIDFGLQFRNWYQQRYDAFANDIRNGVPISELYYDGVIAAADPDLVPSLLYLHRAKFGVFAHLRVEPGPVPPGRAIDGFATGGTGWSTIGRKSSAGVLEPSPGGVVLRWDYLLGRGGVAILGRSFSTPEDWRPMGAMSITLMGQGTGRQMKVRLVSESRTGSIVSYDAPFVDYPAGSHTVVIPWSGFSHVIRGGDVDLQGPIPLQKVIAVVFGVSGQGEGSVVIQRVALQPGHSQLGWPFDSAVSRRSLPPWK